MPEKQELICGCCGALHEGGLCRECAFLLSGIFLMESEEDAGKEEVAPDLKLRSLLGRGVHGEVWLAEDLGLGREVAVKLLRAPDETSDGEWRGYLEWRFEREIHALSALRHSGIAVIHRSGISGTGRPWFAMELVRGRRLDAWLTDLKPDRQAVLSLFQCLCGAVHHAHQTGIIHRDLKPANIMVGEAGAQPKIIDFGLARLEQSLTAGDQLTLDGRILGTPVYMSPEQARGDRMGVGTASDVYSLGGILLYLLAGAPPYDPDRPTLELLEIIRTGEPRRLRDLRPDAPRDLEAVICRAMARRPEERYQGADRLSEDIGRFLSGQPVLARQGQHWYFVRKTLRRHWRGATAAAVIMGSLAGAAAYSVAGEAETARRRAALLENARLALATTLLEMESLAREDGYGEVAAFMAKRREEGYEGSNGLMTADFEALPQERGPGLAGTEDRRPERLKARLRAEWKMEERKFAQAVQEWRQVIRLAKPLLSQERTRPEAERDLASACLGLGLAMGELGFDKESLRELTRARKWLRRLGTSPPASLRSRILFALGHRYSAMARLEEAREALREAVDHGRGMTACLAGLELAAVTGRLGRGEEALRIAEQHLESLSAAAKEEPPGGRPMGGSLLLAEGELAGACALHALGQPARALPWLIQSRQRYEGLEEQGARFQRYRVYREVEKLRRRIGTALMETSPAEARRVLERARDKFRTLEGKTYAHAPSVMGDMALTLRFLGDCCLKLDDRAAAARQYRLAAVRFARQAKMDSSFSTRELDALECALEARALQAWDVPEGRRPKFDWPEFIKEHWALATRAVELKSGASVEIRRLESIRARLEPSN